MSHRAKFWLFAGLAFGLSLIAGFVIGKTVPASGGVDNPAMVLPALLGFVVVLFAASWLWWKNTDDLQQQGQLISWWWGGTSGALIMMICMFVLTGRHSDLSLGGTYVFLAQFAGMLIVWLGWKFRGRGLSE